MYSVNRLGISVISHFWQDFSPFNKQSAKHLTSMTSCFLVSCFSGQLATSWLLNKFQLCQTGPLYACMCLEYDGSQTKDVPSFFWTFLIKSGLLYLCCSYTSCFYIEFGWITWKSCYTGLLMFWNTFIVIIKIIALIGIWRTTQKNNATTILYVSDLG
jgi:hypothetical protein